MTRFNKLTIIIGITVGVIGLGSTLLSCLGYRFSINSEWAKLYNTQGGYRSWTISYSHGQTLDQDGDMINLWKWPSFHHADVRPWLRTQETEETQ